MEERDLIKNIIIENHEKGLTPRQISEVLNKKGLKRSDGKDISRKDVNNRLMHLRNAGLIENNNNNSSGETMSEQTDKITIDLVKEKTGLSQLAISKKLKVAPTSIVRWKTTGIPDRYLPRFEKLISSPEEAIPEITNSVGKKRKYSRKEPVLKEVTAEQIGLSNNSDSTIFIITKNSSLIKELISRFI